MTLVALGRGDVADFVITLTTVLTAVVVIYVILSFLPRVPYYRWLDAFISFVNGVTEPMLRPFRRLPQIRLGGAALDLSPLVLLIVLQLVGGILATLIRG